MTFWVLLKKLVHQATQKIKKYENDFFKFFFLPFTLDWKSPIILTDKCMVFNRLDSGYVCVCEGIIEKKLFVLIGNPALS